MPHVASLKTCSWEPLGFFGHLFWEPCLPSLGTLLGNCLGTSYWEPLRTLLGNLVSEPALDNLWKEVSWELLGTFANLALEPAWEPSLGTLLGNLAWEPCLGTSYWEPLPENLCATCLGTWLGKFACNLLLGILLGNVFLGTFGNLWEPVPGNLGNRGNLGNLGNLVCEPSQSRLAWELGIFGNLFLGTLLGNLAWKPALGNLFLRTFANLGEPALGNLWKSLGSCSWQLCLPCLGTFANLAWEGCLETRSWEPLWIFGNGTFAILAWEPLLGNLWEPPEPCLGTLPANLLLGTFLLETSSWEPLQTLLGNLAWELGTWEPCAVGFWLLRPAPGPLLWLKSPSLHCWGKRYGFCVTFPLHYHWTTVGSRAWTYQTIENNMHKCGSVFFPENIIPTL